MSLSVTFLGTGGSIPTPGRNPSALFVRREGDQLLFDCGEGTQRQMMRFQTGFSMSSIFLTHCHGDHVLGLPGLLQTMDFNDREEALTIYTPAGTTGVVEDLVGVVGGAPSFPVSIEGVQPGQEVTRKEGYGVVAFQTDHDARSVGYALLEDERKGRFDRERAEALGVPPGPLFSTLHEGTPVELEDGTVVEPDAVVGPPRPGRSVVYTGDTRPTAATVAVADEPDLLIHDGTFIDAEEAWATETGHSTARQAGEIAKRAGARRLALVHLSSRYGGEVERHLEEAIDGFGSEAVVVPSDGECLEVPFPE